MIRTSKGLVVITGCSHAGLTNTVLQARKIGEQSVYALLGGYHFFQMKLGDSSTVATLKWAAAQLAQQGISYLLGAHCAGLEAFKTLRELLSMNSSHAMFSTIATVFDLNKGILPPSTALNTPNP